MELESQEEGDQVKIRRYQDQLEQVEAALTVNPAHEDLLSIKNDLLEIIKILRVQGPQHPWEEDGGTSLEGGLVGAKIKTENQESSSLLKQKDLSNGNSLQKSEDVKVKAESSNGFSAKTKETEEAAPAMEDYLNRRKEDKKLFNYISKYGKRKDITDADSEGLTEEMKSVISNLLPPELKQEAGDCSIGRPITAVNRGGRITDKKLMNYLNKQQKKVRRKQINEERIAQGLPPISFSTNKKRKVE